MSADQQYICINMSYISIIYIFRTKYDHHEKGGGGGVQTTGIYYSRIALMYNTSVHIAY
jgi:hypothetical protein